ncbi:hypothetical protein GCM10027275_21580 [Rhabdobacter roseus]|uniref:Uncharacterized protein n=1 Tax=Rhabdobacter roseus TaxID=1655419 RepID=A0A840TS57_9BACT|nr:hypothetical protein [Rhabdobacter roseus]MBB5284093.1 hypothetical protein [Rhabdobacter roseus]
MSPKLIKTLLLASAIGFLVLWILEFRRTSLAESYWLLLLCLIFLLSFQYYRLKVPLLPGSGHKPTSPAAPRKNPPPKRTRRK